MKKKGTVLIVLGIAGIIFVLLFDIIVGKPNYYIGPKSIAAFIACMIFIITGTRSLRKKP
ncbi:MAG: hypothetical protein KJ706_03130 [Candidatus Omnitrophica bacterium]|nr:hypothetical protein [Candidatus Omnitrophota bacterium]